MNGPKIATPLNRWFDFNSDKVYKVTSSKYWYFDISHAIISNMWTAVLSV